MAKETHRKVKEELIILSCIVFVILFFVICTQTSVNIFESGPGKCISISHFGKVELYGIDKVVISTQGNEVVLIDSDQIDAIVEETRLATHVDSECHQDCCGCEYPHSQIDLYRGDRLIRSMEWQECCGFVKVYEPDLTHWLIAPGGEKVTGGYVELSNKLVDQLNALIDQL